MTRSPLRCCTSIIRSSAFVQASSSLSIGRARTWPTEATRHRNTFSPFSRDFFLKLSSPKGLGSEPKIVECWCPTRWHFLVLLPVDWVLYLSPNIWRDMVFKWTHQSTNPKKKLTNWKEAVLCMLGPLSTIFKVLI